MANVHAQRIDDLLALPHDWDTYDAMAPNQQAADAAKAFVAAGCERGLEPDRIVADVEGGIEIIYFAAGPRYVWVSFANDGTALAGLREYYHPSHEVWTVGEGGEETLARTLDRIRECVATEAHHA